MKTKKTKKDFAANKIFWDVLMFYQILLSPQCKQFPNVTDKHGIY